MKEVALSLSLCVSVRRGVRRIHDQVGVLDEFGEALPRASIGTPTASIQFQTKGEVL